MNEPLVIIAGPTAVGKTALSIALAKKLNGEIISGDSMQVYRGMDIGTAKITPAETEGVAHHLIDICEPREGFSAAKFQSLAQEKIAEITARGHLPIVAGGTGLYLSALIYDYDFAKSEQDDEYRAYLNQIAEEKGAQFLWDMLNAVDHLSAAKLNLRDTKRIMRALEVYHLTGSPISAQKQEGRTRVHRDNTAFIVLDMNRAKLYERIDSRIDEMLKQGWLDEVQKLLADGLTRADVAMQGLGYRQLAAYLEGECSYEEAVYQTKRDTRHFAKRQLTWFRRESCAAWINKDGRNETEILNEALKIIKEKIPQIG